jgi:outer membrane protein assembly factor BamB
MFAAARRSFSGLALLGGLSALMIPAAAANDLWPSLWGPSGDGRAAAAAKLPVARGLRIREAWRKPLGSGFSAIAVAAGRAYTALSDGTGDHAVALDAGSGRELWQVRIGDTYRGHDGSRDGPASTPATDDTHVFVLSRHGALFALDAKTGAVTWKRDLTAELKAQAPFYGFGTSPLVSGANVVVQIGGETGLVAFERASGRVAWSASHSKTSGYASPILATLAGTPQLLALANDVVYAVRPTDGALLWTHPTGWQDEAMRAPLAAGDRVLISGVNEAKLIEVRKDGAGFRASEAWRTPRLKNSLSPTVLHEGHLFGFNSGYLTCLDAASGDLAWRERTYAGSLILVDGHLLILGAESGELRIGRASPAAYEERLRVPVFNAGATSVTGPSFANGRVFLRNLEEIVALEVIQAAVP